MNNQTWKKVIIRCILGAPIGLAISTIITIVISVLIGDGSYYAVVPALIEDFGTEIKAVLVQALCSLVYGAAFGGASVIWENEWSVLKMTVTHFLICSIATFPIAYLMRWMDHKLSGVLEYFGIFILIYIIIWVSQYARMKRKVNIWNKKINELTK